MTNIELDNLKKQCAYVVHWEEVYSHPKVLLSLYNIPTMCEWVTGETWRDTQRYSTFYVDSSYSPSTLLYGKPVIHLWPRGDQNYDLTDQLMMKVLETRL